MSFWRGRIKAVANTSVQRKTENLLKPNSSLSNKKDLTTIKLEETTDCFNEEEKNDTSIKNNQNTSNVNPCALESNIFSKNTDKPSQSNDIKSEDNEKISDNIVNNQKNRSQRLGRVKAIAKTPVRRKNVSEIVSDISIKSDDNEKVANNVSNIKMVSILKTENIHPSKNNIKMISILKTEKIHPSKNEQIDCTPKFEDEKSSEQAVPKNEGKNENPTVLKSKQNLMSDVPKSPIKFSNQPRIKSLPRIPECRNNGSASESDDEVRKIHCASGNHSVIKSRIDVQNRTDNATNTSVNILHSGQVIKKNHRKKTEHARKLAEAKRDFTSKFGDKDPDSKRLTLMDIIVYNPTSNPMPIRERNIHAQLQPKKQEVLENPKTEQIIEEEVDDVDESTIPAPQIKIGLNGEIILDETSIVVETKKIAMNNQPAIVIDDQDTGYGIFKRAKRTKDWSELETRKFYLALQMLGTDFSMMLQFFKGRTRRDLKLKFKKEEKLNSHLIDQATLNPCPLNLSKLRKDLENEELKAKKKDEEKKRKFNEARKRTSDLKKAATEKKKYKKTDSWFARQMEDNEVVSEKRIKNKKCGRFTEVNEEGVSELLLEVRNILDSDPLETENNTTVDTVAKTENKCEVNQNHLSQNEEARKDNNEMELCDNDQDNNQYNSITDINNANEIEMRDVSEEDHPKQINEHFETTSESIQYNNNNDLANDNMQPSVKNKSHRLEIISSINLTGSQLLDLQNGIGIFDGNNINESNIDVCEEIVENERNFSDDLTYIVPDMLNDGAEPERSFIGKNAFISDSGCPNTDGDIPIVQSERGAVIVQTLWSSDSTAGEQLGTIITENSIMDVPKTISGYQMPTLAPYYVASEQFVLESYLGDNDCVTLDLPVLSSSDVNNGDCAVQNN